MSVNENVTSWTRKRIRSTGTGRARDRARGGRGLSRAAVGGQAEIVAAKRTTAGRETESRAAAQTRETAASQWVVRMATPVLAIRRLKRETAAPARLLSRRPMFLVQRTSKFDKYFLFFFKKMMRIIGDGN